MPILVLGINHDSAPIEVRERVAFAPELVPGALAAARKALDCKELAILSTCNRTEIYGQLEPGRLLEWLADYHQVDLQQLEKSCYCYTGESAVRHMMRVACGLDSLVLGEPQILGQIKSAYAVARDSGSVGSLLHSTFQQVFAVAKKVRTETAIGENPVSVAYAAVSLASRIFTDLSQQKALLIGAGETIELVARHLLEQGVNQLIVANRTLSRAQQLADNLDAEAILLADIPQHLPRADIVISSTASQLPILGKGAVETALKKRRHRPVFMVDIAVPRDIEPQVGQLDDVYLYTVDDLRGVIDEGKRSREKAAEAAHTIVDSAAAEFMRQYRALGAVDSIRSYRRRAQEIGSAELERALAQLEKGGDPRRLLEQLTRSLTNKLIHAPTVSLKRATAEGDLERLRVVREVIGLDPSPNAELEKKDG
ncbi:glutamyl-tRNA reductase [Microbulbifer thermotolerans]|uniref:Glutamyl-tRNA reductase n=1 Tax=Microbulbifer thermotolerans TaxID=252514 RepID=A0A143HK10_MICTH|nr:glutamyl-tRNA reductase [Microbulbifer thermotolerans]AMX02003.1 glutamyl-tRNA reductase [Microbulbifer thermotolerans]MCX2783133.1 glutamyl-tRNA reductase [Microbulbifer thermotolerans]MCX2794265.1 glutamyl-tRNA reductase [Microbulbifer thermotolerans]MCX2800713.1 glutamyl-tRNA reductase [Microbulbifer thermotolerans]MCX2830026.1 glutamyl-tRNA reductase [Microbulbifer thermotolerans]